MATEPWPRDPSWAPRSEAPDSHPFHRIDRDGVYRFLLVHEVLGEISESRSDGPSFITTGGSEQYSSMQNGFTMISIDPSGEIIINGRNL